MRHHHTLTPARLAACSAGNGALTNVTTDLALHDGCSVYVPPEPGRQRKTLITSNQPYTRSGRQWRTKVLITDTTRPNNFTVFEGSSEIQRMLVGRALTGLDVR